MACQMVYHNGNCLNTKKSFLRACRLCIDSCPHQAISEYRQLEAKHCTECGACMAACPSDGFVDRTMDQLHEYLWQAKEVILNCPKAIPIGFEISCLGMLDRDGWMTLMLLAKEKTVTIVTGVCAECDDRQACAASVRTFKQVHADWPEHASVRIQVRPDQEVKTIGTEGLEYVDQRLKMSDWRQIGRNKLEELLPSLAADETYPMPRSRQWLIQALEQNLEDKIPFQALIVADSCTSCGVCTAICPQNALQKREEMDLVDEKSAQEDKIKFLRLILEPQKCVHCGRCLEVCRTEALSFSTKRLNYHLLTGKILLHEGKPHYCSQCGKRIFDSSDLCLVCSTSCADNRSSFFL